MSSELSTGENRGLRGCVRLLAAAKVNLSLDIIGTTPDGYHAIETIMHSVSLQDELTIKRRCGDGIAVTCSDPSITCGEGNVAYTAATEFLRATGLADAGISIHIDKRIPAEAGLGGGSADAAAVIAGLNRLLGTELSREQLREIGLATGMDVPFCLAGGCALATGRGEILTPLPILPDCRIVIAKPSRGMSTKHAYALYDGYKGRLERPDTAGMIASLKAGDLSATGAGMVNVFGAIDETAGTLRDAMLKAGALGAALTGSGSAVFGIFSGSKQPTLLFPPDVADGLLVFENLKPISRSIEFLAE